MKESDEQKIRREISEEFDRWNKIAVNGCSDPGYPDGVNMNLLRNHIIYGYRKLEEIGAIIFDLFGDPMGERAVPPKVPDNYMVREGRDAHRLDKWEGTFLHKGLFWRRSGEYRA